MSDTDIDLLRYFSLAEIETAKRRRLAVQMRDERKMTWPAIGRVLGVQREAAKSIYDTGKWNSERVHENQASGA